MSSALAGFMCGVGLILSAVAENRPGGSGSGSSSTSSEVTITPLPDTSAPAPQVRPGPRAQPAPEPRAQVAPQPEARPRHKAEGRKSPKSDRSRKCSKQEAEIDRLRAVNPWGTPDIFVEYKVEIEHPCPEQTFDLVLQIRHRENVLMEVVVPLDQPTEVDDDEIEFKGGFEGQFGVVVLEDRSHLRIEGRLVERASGQTMDRDSERVKDAYGTVFVYQETMFFE